MIRNMTLFRSVLPQRFWNKVYADDYGCWLWMGAQVGRGYPQWRYAEGGKEHWLAHRAAYACLVGPIPDGLTLDHLCRIRLCVNPWHLEPVTAIKNQQRGTLAKTHCQKGHEFTTENTLTSEGFRRCKACRRASDAARSPRTDRYEYWQQRYAARKAAPV